MQMSELQAKSNNNLALCPFCGGKARPFELTWHAGQFGAHMFEKPYWQVICGECKAAIGDFNSKSEAIAIWNSRAERTCKNKNKSVTSFWCSKCDAATSDGFADVGGKLARFNYCPNCGRRCI